MNKLISILVILVSSSSLFASDLYRVKGIPVDDTLSIRENPDVNSKKIGEVPYNFFGISIEKCQKFNLAKEPKEWCKIVDNVGWLAKKYLEKSNEPNAQDEQYKNKWYKVIKHKKGEYLNVRKGMGTQYKVMGELPYNAENILVFSCVQKTNTSNWCWIIKVSDDITGVMTGWVSSKYIEKIQKNQVKNSKTNDEIKKAEEYNQIALEAYHNKDYPKSIEYYEKSLAINIKVYGENHKETAMSHQDLGSLYLSIGDYNSSIKHYETGAEIVMNVCQPDDPLYIQFLANLSNYYSLTGDYKNAIASYTALAIILKKLNNLEVLYQVYGNMALMYQNAGNYSEAIANSKKSLNILLKNYPKEKNLIADGLNTIGTLYYQNGDYKNSLLNYNKSLKVYSDNNNTKALISIYNNLGLLFYNIKDYSSAMRNYKKSS